MNAAAETRLLLAMARYLANDGEHAPSIFDVEDALKAVEATGENAKESGIRPPSSTGGAGGGDPLPQPTDVQKRIAAIEQRVNALGIEPWFYIHSPECLQPHTVAEGRRSHWRAVCSMTYNAPKCDTDARFIAEARQDVPWLLDQLARLSRVHQQLKAECVRLVDEWRIWAEKRAKQAMDFEHAQRAQMLHESCLHVIRADELEKALRLAASTTETPP